MELWNEDVRPTAKPILPATMSIPAIADTDCGQVITAAVAQSFRVMKACEGLPDTTRPCGCTGAYTCPTCIDQTHFLSELFFEVRGGLEEALLCAPFFVGPFDEFEYETTRG